VLDRDALAALGVDDELIATRRRLDGERAVAFLAGLPELAARRQAQFGLTGARMLAGGALSAVLACTRIADARPVVLKLLAGDGGGDAEAAALALWNGAGACALLAVSDDGAALLLDAIEPGAAAQAGADEPADVRRAAELLALLHRDPHDVPTAIPDAAATLGWRFDRARRFVADGRAFAAVTPAELDAAQRAAADLLGAAARTLCHGDFLDKNILLDRHGRWWAIDPMPCIGDACLDAAFWALHHRPGSGVARRCDRIAAAADLDSSRVRGWARAFAATEAALDNGPGRAAGHLRVLRG
jgi:streptomycin 6-kinase